MQLQRRRPAPVAASPVGYAPDAQGLGGSNQEAIDAMRQAGSGLAGAGGSFPHLDEIAASLGGHDLSGVGAFMDGLAADACSGLGANGFAVGEEVAFAKGSPDLWTAAHEMAHVVQQRAGVSLPGGTGSVGDPYEQMADAVADRVVAGESAEDLLPEPRSARSLAAGVQFDNNGAGGAPNDGNNGAEGGPGYYGPEPERTVNVDMVDDTDFTGYASSVVHPGDVNGFTNTCEMVDMAIRDADGNPISTLWIDDHGTPGAQEIGDQQLTAAQVREPETRACLEELQGHWAEDGEIDLGGCEVAKGPGGEELLRELSAATGVPVTAGFDPQRPLIPGYEGDTMTCYPSGECTVTGPDPSAAGTCSE